MKKVYTEGRLITRLRTELSRYVADTGRKVSQNLTALALAVLIVWNRITVRWLWKNAPELLGARSLNSYYYGLEDAVRSEPDEAAWIVNMRKVSGDLAAIIPPEAGGAPILLAVDDTLIEKYGEHFDDVGINFDHAAHDGRKYKNSHVFVSVTVIAPVEMTADGKAVCASFPLGSHCGEIPSSIPAECAKSRLNLYNGCLMRKSAEQRRAADGTRRGMFCQR